MSNNYVAITLHGKSLIYESLHGIVYIVAVARQYRDLLLFCGASSRTGQDTMVF